MIDALGRPSSILVFGGSSEIAEAVVRRLAAGGRLSRVVLAARPTTRRDEVADRLGLLGIDSVEAVDYEATEDGAEKIVSRASAAGDLDVVLVAVGSLPEQAAAIADPDLARAAALDNYVGPMSACLHSAAALRRQGHGTLVVMSSVAAERPRVANFVYGSAKAGLDALATGLGDELAGSGVRVLVVRPGFVATRMTTGLRPAPFATTADAVADAVARNLAHGPLTIWVPGVLRPVMTVLRHLPRAVFRRLPA